MADAIRRCSIRWVGLAILLMGAAPCAGQVVRGTVVDDQNLANVSAATVRLVVDDRLGAGTETDAEGRFRLAVPGGGDYRLEVSRLGYRTARSQLIRVEDDDTVTVEFRVDPDAVVLAPITVTARSTLGRNLFEVRRNEGKGVFLRPGDIGAMKLRHPADVFKGVEGVDVFWGWGALGNGARGPLPSVRSRSLRGCVFYMVDRVWVRPPPWADGDWSSPQLSGLLPEDIVAVEAYRSISEVPNELRRFTHRDNLVNCGLVVFWTRAGW